MHIIAADQALLHKHVKSAQGHVISAHAYAASLARLACTDPEFDRADQARAALTHLAERLNELIDQLGAV